MCFNLDVTPWPWLGVANGYMRAQSVRGWVTAYKLDTIYNNG
jgi:hypothetical protein